MLRPVSGPFPEDRQIRLNHTQSYAPGRRQFFLSPWLQILPYTSGYCSFAQGTSKSIREQPVPAVLRQYAMTPHPSSVRPTSSTSTEPAVASPDPRRISKTLTASSATAQLLHYHQQRPSPAFCHANAYSATQRFDTASV